MSVHGSLTGECVSFQNTLINDQAPLHPHYISYLNFLPTGFVLVGIKISSK